MLSIHSNFDGGNIELVDAASANDVRLRIRPDEGGRHSQWFCFQLCNAGGQAVRMVIENADQVSYPDGFEGYQAVASYDREHWFRVDTGFDGSELTIRHTPRYASVFYAYFAPYSLERHQSLIAFAEESERARAEVLCVTPDGHPLTLLTIGPDADEPTEGRKKLWITARQHPGETMAEWWVEGFLDRLLDASDPVARRLLDESVIYLVPNMNPDGSVRGHLRVNARGVNLNRAWKEPSEEDSPEVFFVREKMHETGVDFALDVHGDEALPYNFIAGGEGVPRWDEAMEDQLAGFKALLASLSPDFQTEYGYERDKPGSADLRKCTDYIAETFGCLAMTLEMPFKDTADDPQPETGWSPARSRNLGAACVDAFWQYLPRLER